MQAWRRQLCNARLKTDSASCSTVFRGNYKQNTSSVIQQCNWYYFETKTLPSTTAVRGNVKNYRPIKYDFFYRTLWTKYHKYSFQGCTYLELENHTYHLNLFERVLAGVYFSMYLTPARKEIVITTNFWFIVRCIKILLQYTLHTCIPTARRFKSNFSEEKFHAFKILSLNLLLIPKTTCCSFLTLNNFFSYLLHLISLFYPLP